MRNRLTSSLLAVALLTCSATTKAEDTGYHNLVLSTLDANSTDIRVVGVLKYCEMGGLKDVLLQKISDAIVEDLYKRKVPEVEVNETGVKLLQAADIEAQGIAEGLAISQMEATKKARFCSMAASLADQALSEQQAESGK